MRMVTPGRGRSWIVSIYATGVLLTVAALSAGQLSEKDVRRAIGRAEKLVDPTVCLGSSAPGEFTVCLQGPEQRIAVAAALAKQARRDFRAEDVSDEFKAPTWVIYVRPNAPALVDGQSVRTSPANDLRLQSHDASDIPAVRPGRVTPTAYTWDNAVGVGVTGQGLTATVPCRQARSTS
jgi:hypothetical protein